MERPHIEYMKKCIELGKKALANGDPPVGSIVVLDEEIIGEGIESGKTTNDNTNHAEILAIRDSIVRGYKNDLRDSVLYTTHEPCIMCSYLIRQHQISTIVYGVSVDHVGGHSSKFDILDTEIVPKWGQKPKIIEGVLASECEQLTDRFKRAQKGN